MKSSAEHMNLVGRYLSGQAHAEAAAQLEVLMLADPQLRADFLACARVDAALPGMIGGKQKLVPFESTEARKPRLRFPAAMAAAGAMAVLLGMILVGGLWWWQGAKTVPVKQTVARFGALQDCRWVHSRARVQPGDAIEVGQRIELSSGSADVLFNTGARLTLTGPAILEARSDNSSFLTLGEVFLVAETPESKGFVIETPVSKFIDIGTAFSATVSPDGLSRLEVTEGEVDVVLDGIAPRRLRRGETIYVEPGAQKIMTRIESGDGTPAFRFPSIPPPSSSDYADQAAGHASIRVAKGELTQKASGRGSGPASVLLDGAGQSRQDAPRESAFFKANTQGSFLIDLGEPMPISKINAYSWHQHDLIEEHRERARQRFTLFGCAEDTPPDLDRPRQKAGWTRIARVNSDQFFRVDERLDRPAQQACSITAAQGDIGPFRYLLWDVNMNSFYGEFDVFGKPE